MKEQLEALASMIRSAWRFRWSAILAAALLVLVGSFAVLIIPGKYQSHAQIYIDTKSVLRPLLQGLAVAQQTRDDTDVVRRALLAHPTLDKVARKTGLYARTKTPEAAEKLLADLSNLIIIHGDSATGLYTITYEDNSARMAQAVVKTLLDSFYESSIGAGRTDSTNAENFLSQQVAEYERRLSQSEQQLADFKKKNIGLMPDQRGDYFARLQAEIATRDKLQTDLAVMQQQRDALRRKIVSDGQGVGAAVLANPPSNQQIQAAEALDARIREAKSALDALLDKYTDQHPQVIAQRETIRRLEEQRRAELGDVRMTNPSRSEGSPVAIDPVIQNLQIGLNGTDVQVATLETQLKQSEARVADLQRAVTTGPEIEAELARLNRDYGVTKAQYETLLQRLESARISSDADRSEELRFKVLEPPRVALQSIKPNRSLLITGVFFAALFCGAALAVLRAQTQPVFFAKSAVSAALNLPVIGVVSRAYSPSERAARGREKLAYVAVASVLLLCVAVGSSFGPVASRMLRAALGLGEG